MVKILTFALFLLPSIGFACQDKVDVLAKNIYFEARGEGNRGMELVADVTMNRVIHDNFPNTICSVVNQKGQFTWKRGQPIKNKEKWDSAVDIAEQTIKNGPNRKDILFFKRGNTRKWQNREKKLTYKNHSFY